MNLVRLLPRRQRSCLVYITGQHQYYKVLLIELLSLNNNTDIYP